MNNFEIGERVKLLRKKSGLSQERMAELLGDKRSTYANRESHGSLTVDDIKNICEILDIDPYFLLYGKVNPRIEPCKAEKPQSVEIPPAKENLDKNTLIIKVECNNCPFLNQE